MMKQLMEIDTDKRAYKKKYSDKMSEEDYIRQTTWAKLKKIENEHSHFSCKGCGKHFRN